MMRYMRIAFSLGCTAVCLLWAVLWVRSYSDHIGREVLVTPTFRYELSSRDGALVVVQRRRVFITLEGVIAYPETMFTDVTDTPFGIGRYFSDFFNAAGVSYDLLMVSTAAAGAAPWLRWRFSLRSLLVALTLAALLLGWFVSAPRN